MSADRRREAARIAGLFMLLVQARLLWIFYAGLLYDTPAAPQREYAVMLRRITWLRPVPWGPVWLPRFGFAFIATALGIAVTLMILGVRRWRRGRTELV
jgi:hypothetical protein